MIREERDEIKRAPEWPWLYYGDGYCGRIIKMVHGKNANGIDVWKMKVLPIEELKRAHEVGLEVTDDEGAVNVEYPMEFVYPLSSDPAWTVYFCFLDFWGQTVPATQFLKGFQDIRRISELLNEIRMLKAENAYLREKYEKAKTEPITFIREHVMELIDELKIKVPDMPSVVNPVRVE